MDADGTMLGIVPLQEALRKASLAKLDLVEISPMAEPPVCKILDFGKFRYEQKKKVQTAKKKQKITVIKEMKFKMNIGQGDFDTKIKKIKSFLLDDDKVKISLWFKGREIMHNELGLKLFDRIIAEITDICKIESEPKFEGKQIIMVVAPLK